MQKSAPSPLLFKIRNLSPLLLAVTIWIAVIALRCLGTWWLSDSSNPDFGIVVLMARHMAEGLHWPVFFYGQPYMGSLEPSVSALLVRIFGPSPLIVSLGTTLIGLLILWAVWVWAGELGGRKASVWTLLVAAAGPSGYFHYMVSPRGGYALGLLLTVLLLREGARQARAARICGSIKTSAAIKLGILVGLGFWNFWLTLPAAAAAALLVLSGLRWRIPPWRIWAAGLTSFFAASLPFWVWNAANGWQSFGSQQSTTGPRQFLLNIWLLFTDRLPLLLDLHRIRHSAGTVVVGLAFGFLLVAAVLQMLPERKSAWRLRTWLLAGIALYLVFFVIACGASAFCIARTPRYLIPFVPLFSVITGVTVADRDLFKRGKHWRPLNRRHTVMAVTLRSALIIIVVFQLFQLPVSVPHGTWIRGAAEIAEALNLENIDAAVADFKLAGFNWATDERLCCSSPLQERYRPYAQKLEQAGNPAVLENFRGFDHFLLATGASSSFDRIGGYRVHSSALPPATDTTPVGRHRIDSITGSDGVDYTEALTDQFLATQINILDPFWIEINFTKPQTVAGLRAWVADKEGFAEWSVSGRTSRKETFQTLSPPHVLSGYFWSGKRFYYDGTAARMEKLFPPVKVQALRLQLTPRKKNDEPFFISIAELQPLHEYSPFKLPDINAIAASIRKEGLTDIYADRWLANNLKKILADSPRVSLDPGIFQGKGHGENIVLKSGCAFAVEPDTVDSVRLGLRRIGLSMREYETGGVILCIPETPAEEQIAYPGLRFKGRLLMHSHPRTLADFLWKNTSRLPQDWRRAALNSALSDDPGSGCVWRELAEFALREGRPHEAQLYGANTSATISEPLYITFFRDKLELLRVKPFALECRAGDKLTVQSEWRKDPDFKIPSNAGVSVQFLRDGKLEFQQNIPYAFKNAAADSMYDTEITLHHAVQIPLDTAPGSLVPAVGITLHGPLRRLANIRTPLATRHRRAIMPVKLEIQP